MAELPVSEWQAEIDPSTDEGRLLLEETPEATRDWIEHFLTVPNEIGQIVKMRLFPQQLRMLYEETGRDVTVKGRQTRASSLKMARNVRRMTTGQVWGATCVMGAQDDATTALFRQRIRHHIFNDLKNKGVNLKIKLDNDDELVIEELDNRFMFVSGEQRTMARGFAGQILHFSEFAHWKDSALELLGGAIPSVPSPPYGFIDLESTPKGETGAFYKYALGARPFDLSDPFTVHLYPWWMEPRYIISTSFYSNADIKLSEADYRDAIQHFEPDDYEVKLMAGLNYNGQKLTVDQIIWRRLKKKSQDKTNAPFLQEYPEDLDTCWLGVQGRFFDTPDSIDHLNYYRDNRLDPVKWFDKLTYRGDEISFYGNNFGIWEYPDQGDTYVAGFDAAGGGLNDDSDWSVLYIISVKKEKIVARLRVRAGPKVFAAMVAATCTFFKSATISGERSHHGDMVFKELRDLEYTNIYYHVDPFKPIKKGQIALPGLYPTEEHRRDVLERFKVAITNNVLISFCKDLVREMNSFTWQKVQQRIKASALEIVEQHDDCIFAAAHAWYIIDKVRMRMRSQQRREEEDILTIGKNGLVIRRGDDSLPRRHQIWLG